MNAIFLTQNSTPIFKYIVWILGKIMEGIFIVIDAIGIPNIGLAIILFTIVVNLLMMPLTIKQQKFSKLSAKMNPEINAIRAKYKNKTDQDSQMAMNQEIQGVYAKYGVSASGSCVQLLIQMPILFALYRVIQSMPAYVTKIGNTFRVLADHINAADGAAWLMNSGSESITRTVQMYGNSLLKETQIENGIIDILNRLSSSDMMEVASHYDLGGLTYNGHLILSNEVTRGLIDTYNNFLGLNIGDSPSNLIKEAFAAGQWAILIGAVLIPVLSAVTQWINVKLMPQQPTDGQNDQASSMASSMKTMNMIMPLMSAWFCFTLPSGMGLYWVAGSVVRSIQQVAINKHIDKMDFDEIIKKNSVKSAKKMEKLKQQQAKIDAYAKMNTKNIQSRATVSTVSEKAQSTSSTTGTTEAKSGSMFAKANMVKQYNEKNNTDKK